MIRLIAAIDDKHGIARRGIIPWDIPMHGEYAREVTSRAGANVLMGRVTLQIMNGPMPGHNNFVLTHDARVPFPNVQVVHSKIGDFLRAFIEDVWVIGGASVYEQAIPYADELYLTHVEGDFGCDKFFPEFRDQFTMVDQSPLEQQNGESFRFEVWRSNALVEKEAKAIQKHHP